MRKRRKITELEKHIRTLKRKNRELEKHITPAKAFGKKVDQLFSLKGWGWVAFFGCVVIIMFLLLLPYLEYF